MDFLLSKYGLIFTEFDSIDRGGADLGKIPGISCFIAHYLIKLEMKLSEVFKTNIKH